MAEPLADTDDVQGAWRTLTADEMDPVEHLLRRASAYVRSQFPTLQARLDAGQADRDDVAAVVTDMVIRVLRNPEGYRQVSETVGPFTRSGTFTNDAPSGLTLSDADRAILAPPATRRGPRIGSFRVSPWPRP